MTFNIRLHFTLCTRTTICILPSSTCAFRIVESLKIAHPMLKDITHIDTHTLLPNYSSVLTIQILNIIPDLVDLLN